MGCSRRPNSDWREVESEGVAGEGVHVVTPLPILARPRAGKGTHYFSRDFETDRQWFLNRVLNQRFSGEPQTSASFASTLTSPKNCYGSDVAELSAAPSDPLNVGLGVDACVTALVHLAVVFFVGWLRPCLHLCLAFPWSGICYIVWFRAQAGMRF